MKTKALVIVAKPWTSILGNLLEMQNPTQIRKLLKENIYFFKHITYIKNNYIIFILHHWLKLKNQWTIQ